jgi:light-regulated signal transduction histidine kinase (bacteriophytochrome)
MVNANMTLFTQVFQNLIGNGIKYNKSEVPHISVSHMIEGDMHQFDISDNGIGIASEFHGQVFDMFKRLHRQDEYSGTGIGLAICKKVIEKAGGSIWLQSEVGQGSVFSFSWPVAQPANPISTKLN